MSADHIFYIPVIAIAGLVLGFVWGRGAALKEYAAKQRIQDEKEAERSKRVEERRTKRQSASD